MKVMKVGGSVLAGPKGINHVADIIAEDTQEKVIVVSALGGVTDRISEFLKVLETGNASPRDMTDELRELHFSALAETVMDSTRINRMKGRMNALLECWERVAFGAHYTGELTPRCSDFLMSLGERLSVILLEGALKDRGTPAQAVEMEKIGCITDGQFGCATVDLDATREKMPDAIRGIIQSGCVPIITGFFGVDPNGHTTTFGRGGADYSAAVVANVMDAEVLELWKDVDGFYTSDPDVVQGARHIECLNYDEAAELAYFGAKILHPLTIWPLKDKKIPLWVGNVACKDRSRGTWVREYAEDNGGAVKSVAHTSQIGILKFHGAGVGIQPGILSRLVTEVSDSGINIKSVITSQTCIALLLDRNELRRCHAMLDRLSKNLVESIEVMDSVGLIGIVGGNLNQTKGVAGKIFSAVARVDINVEMISSGASEGAYYFILQERDVEEAVRAIHNELFPLQIP